MVEFERQEMQLQFDAKIVALYKDILKTPDGQIVEYDYIKHKHGGGAGVLLVDEQESTYLVKQYRNSINGVDLEIPAGGYSYQGEEPQVCAVREAMEEVGLKPNRIYRVSDVVSSIGTFDERTCVFVGTDLENVERHLDDTEFIDIVRIPVSQARDMIYDGQIIDSKTVIAILAYYDMKSRGIIS